MADRAAPVATMARLEELLATAGVKVGKDHVIHFCLCGKGEEKILRLLGPGRQRDNQADQERDAYTFNNMKTKAIGLAEQSGRGLLFILPVVGIISSQIVDVLIRQP